jgi:hypothetical protein
MKHVSFTALAQDVIIIPKALCMFKLEKLNFQIKKTNELICADVLYVECKLTVIFIST